MKNQFPLRKQDHRINYSFWGYLYLLCNLSVLISCNNNRSSTPGHNDIFKKQPEPGNISKKTFSKPDIVSLSIVNHPKTIPAGKPAIKIDSSYGGIPFFSHFGTEQGLALNSVLCSATDRSGNLWFGTAGGGVSMYDGNRFTNFTIAQGLISNVVFSIIEDKGSNLWFGTSAGVSKYDGYRFINFTTAEGLAGNFISCIIEDKHGSLWFSTHEGGVSKFDGKKFITYTTSQGLADNYVQCMMEDRKGNLWFGTAAKGVSRFDGNKFRNYTEADGLPDNSVNSIAGDKEDNLWLGTKSGVCKFDGTAFSNYTTDNGLPDNNIHCMISDKTGNLWLGTQSKGISKYDGNRFVSYKSAQNITGNSITSISEDKTGNLWFTSLGSGVSKYEGNSLTNYSLLQALAGNSVFSIIRDRSGSMWFGMYEGGVSKYDGKRFLNFTTKQGLPDETIWSVMQDNEGNIWIGTDKGGVTRYDGAGFTGYTMAQGLINNTVSCMMQDKKGNIWFGTFGGASKFDGKSFTNYTTDQGLPGNNIQSIAEDNSGNIWFATHNDGISKYDGKGFTNYTIASGLASNTVYMTLKAENGDLWFGTNRGASKFDGKNFINYTTAEGLPDNCVWAIAEDKQRNILWFGTNKGLCALRESLSKTDHKPDEVFGVFNENNGYPVKEVNAGALCVDDKGIVWVGSSHNDLIRFDYPADHKKDPGHLKLVIQSIKVDNENICWNDLLRLHYGNDAADSLTVLNEMVTTFGKVLSPVILDSITSKHRNIKLSGVSKFYPVPLDLVLPYNDNTVSIDYSAIDPAIAKRVRYQYMLEGYNQDWSTLSNSTTAVFGNLKAGYYTFKLKALSPFGVRSETEYSFKVMPPWWLTWWAYIFYTVMAAGILVALYRNRIRIMEDRQARRMNIMVATQEEERKRIAWELHDDVGVKLSALKLSLSSLTEKAEKTKNEEIHSLARHSENLISESMQDVRRLLRNLSPGVLEEFGYTIAVEGLVNKINETGQIRFNLVIFGMNGRLKKEYELSLYRITQELINNVLKHARARNVSLQIGHRDEKIILMMEDDGKGFDVNSKSDGYGLHNLDIRTKLMKGTLTIDAAPGKGTSVLIEIPYTKNIL
ncbi:MAG: hypothetical protein JST17_13025 [Bacteroidetes bacterium]|nr:hypothetical protein [Bacteroidota bacterium]MBS1931061.1 hypothetical protein [Bacteroidota bacterium]